MKLNSAVSLLILNLQSLQLNEGDWLTLVVCFIFRIEFLEEKIIWKNKEAHLGKTFSDKCLEHPVFYTMLLFYILESLQNKPIYLMKEREVP